MPAPVRSGDRERLCFGLEKELDAFSDNAAVYWAHERIFKQI